MVPVQAERRGLSAFQACTLPVPPIQSARGALLVKKPHPEGARRRRAGQCAPAAPLT